MERPIILKCAMDDTGFTTGYWDVTNASIARGH
jgi:hypothetical protein